MTLFSSSIHIAKRVGRVALVILLSCIAGACNDEDVVDAGLRADTDGSLTFCIEVPDYVVPTRAPGQVSIDREITTLNLFLFDEKGGFMGIVDAEKQDGKSLDSGEKDDIYDTDSLNGQGTYQASIPQNTEVVHFIANAPAELQNIDINRYKGLHAEEVIAPMVTREHLYWGTSTYADLQQKTFDQEPVILYRNYAKVTWKWEAPAATAADDDNSAVAEIVSIDGWTLCNVPQNATVAPFDADAIGETKGPFHFNLADANSRYACVPIADKLEELVSGTEEGMVSTDNATHLPQPLPIFDHTVEAYGNRVFAIFKITTQKGTDETSKKTQFYKIELLKDTKENGIVVHRIPFDIKRNHIYTINFKGINPDLGKASFEEAVAGPAANNTLVEVEETLPELQSTTSVLRVENGTVRYIDNLTTKYTTTATATIDGTPYTAYNVNDIQIYYSGPYGIVAEWVTDSCHYTDGNAYVPETSTDDGLKLQLKEQADVNGRFTHIVSFYADEFAEGDNTTRHYKEGLIRIRETGAGALSRFVRVYIGNPISFRPLLISSDIPAMTDERLTVAFTIPDEDYLPASLYPIEVRFGSDRIDVEKNLYVDAMKVELEQTEDYSYVYQYENTSGSTWAWNADADNTVKNNWGYKYAYTVENVKEAGEHRITLRTVSDKNEAFSVMMEGLSTVLLNGTRSTAEANIFNTRELKFNVLPENTLETARRIMLDNGLVDTRLVTAYINNLKGNNSVSIPYTLGFFNPEDAENGYMTPATISTGVNLWVYYRPEDLIPGAWATLNNGVPFVDAEGNSFATLTATAATDTLDFTIKNPDLKNSLVFITARSGKNDATGTHPYGGTYTGAALGTKEHVYTGVNADAQAYRSASALVSVLSNWKFNPSVKNEDGVFEYADAYEKKYGSQSTVNTYDFPVRIDRPSGNTATIQIDTKGKLQLIAYPDSPYELTEGTYETVKDNTTQEELYRKSTGSTISLTLKAEASNYCELTFRPLTFDHSCTITFTNGTGSTIYDESEKNTLELTHTPIAVYSNKYMWLDEYNTAISNEVVSDTLFSSSLNVDPVIGQEYVVRLYFLKNDINAVFTEKPEAFTFKFSSNCSEVQSPNTDSKTDNYQILEDGSIQVTQGFKETLTIDGKQYGYVDLILKTTKAASSETMRISTADSPATFNGATAANPIKFYRYSVSGFGNRTIYEAGNEDVKFELSTDKKNWVTLEHNGIYFNTDANLSALCNYNQNVYLRITLPADSEGMEFTLTSTGLTGGTNKVFTPSEKNGYVLEMATTGYGLAEKITLSGESNTAVIKEHTFLLATKTTEEYNPWSISFTANDFSTNSASRNGDGNVIFDMSSGYIQQAIGDYTIAAKINDDALISFYAPYPNMILDLGAAVKNSSIADGAFTIYYDGDENNIVNKGGAIKIDGTEVQEGSQDKDKEAIETGGSSKITELTYELGQAGLYHIKRYGSKEFPLYYINLNKSRTPSDAAIISHWCAKKLDDSQIPNATWGGTGTALADGNLIYLSDFAEKLVLTVNAGLTEDNLTLYLPTAGKYAFKSGDQKVFELSGLTKGTTIELVPASDTDTEIVEGEDIIQLTGYSNTYTYSQNITVKVIPWVELSTDLYEKYTTTNAKGYPIMQVGDSVSMTFTLTDLQHVGKNVQFGLKEYQDNTSLKLLSHGGSVIENAAINAFSTFIWKAVSGTDRTLFQARGYSTTTSNYHPTDVVYNGDILQDGNKAQLFDLAIEGISITYDWGTHTDAKGILPANKVIGSGENDTLPAKNFTLYKEGYTLTGWSDGTTTHAHGAILQNVTGNVTLTPVFTQNNVSLDDRTEPVTITWDFQRKNGAPTVGWEGTDGHVWVAQATVNGETIDVKMDISTSPGKFANASWGDWCQLINGTTLTIPSCTGATVALESYYATTTTTIASDVINQGITTPTYTYNGTDEQIDIIIGDGGYWRTVTVTLPVVEKGINIIPTTDSKPFDLTSGTLNGNIIVEDAGNLGFIKDGNTATYTIRNTVDGGDFQMKYDASTINAGCSITFSLTGNGVTKNVTKTVENSGNFSTYLPYMWYIDNLPAGDYTLTMTFNTTTNNAYVANVKNIEFVEASPYIGLGTWQSEVTYANISVKNLDNNSTVYSSGDSWNTQLSTGLYHDNDSKSYANNQLTITDGSNNGATAVLNVPIPSDNYELTCRAMKTSGAEGFLIMFDYLDDDNYKWWNIGGWGNKRHVVQVNGAQPSETSHSGNVATSDDVLITEGNWYNITIQVRNGVATCTCTPETSGDYYMEYSYPAMTHVTIPTAVYEWYVNETSAVVTLKNGETTTEVFTTTGADKNMQANVSPEDPQVTLANNTTVTLTKIMKLGSGQSITLNLPYKMKLTILWETRGNNDANNYDPKKYCIKITGNETIEVAGNGDMSSQTEKTTYQNELTLDEGTWKIERKDGQPFLYYLKLEPYIGQ